MKQAALFFDIDGTVLSSVTHTIPQSAMDAMAQAQKNGHLLFINTGRTICALPKELYEFKFDGYLCGCGTYLVYRNEILLESHMDPARGREIADKARECSVGVVMEGTEDIIFPKEPSRFTMLEQARIHFGSLGLGEKMYIGEGDCSCDKFFFYTDEQSDLDTIFRFLAPDMDVIDRENGNYEIIQKGFSKGTACEAILKKFGMDLDQAYVFGDSMNDLSMFRYATHTIAMGQHSPGLEPYTEFVTRAVEEDGIAHAMKHYGLI